MAEALSPARSRQTFGLLGRFVLVVASLYWAQRVVIPLALAVLLAFLLGPLVIRLHRSGLGRVPAVLLVVLLAFALLSAIGWVVTGEVADLIQHLPAYRVSLREKV